MIPVVDLFAGPGGLGEGFAQASDAQANRLFDVRLAIEQDSSAHRTLKLRSFLHRFEELPGEYIAAMRGEKSVDALYADHPAEAAAAGQRAVCVSLSEENVKPVRKAVGDALAKNRSGPWVLVGGPPCQAYSIAGRSRNKGVENYVPENDARQTLYVEYLQVVADNAPTVFVMENVKGLTSAQLSGRSVFERIIEDLARPKEALVQAGRTAKRSPKYELFSLNATTSDCMYSSMRPSDFVVHAENYGVPQARHRVFIVGVQESLAKRPNALTPKPMRTVRDAIEVLPKLRSGLSRTRSSGETWEEAVRGIRSAGWLSDLASAHRSAVEGAVDSLLSSEPNSPESFARSSVQGRISRNDPWRVPGLGGFANHEPRSHMASDLARYLFAATFATTYGRSPTLVDFPELLLPNHENASRNSNVAFADRFRVQLWDRPSTTVVSHIAKDGHYYIHPDATQCRSLTVREAARLQTFPDDYLFLGNRTQQYWQVGNAVPPLLARQIAEVVHSLLE